MSNQARTTASRLCPLRGVRVAHALTPFGGRDRTEQYPSSSSPLKDLRFFPKTQDCVPMGAYEGISVRKSFAYGRQNDPLALDGRV